jgi:hypothetical protein
MLPLRFVLAELAVAARVVVEAEIVHEALLGLVRILVPGDVVR